MSYSEDQIPVCTSCEANVDLDQPTKLCRKCGIAFCQHYSSNIDIRYCSNCMEDFRVIETIEIKTTERVDEDGNILSRKRQMAKHLKLEGTDWLFEAVKIRDMTDEQLLFSVEYHDAIKSMLVMEREERKIERYRKLQGIKVSIRAKTVDNATSGEKKTRVKTEKKAADANSAATVINALLGVKIDPVALAALLEKAKK